MLGGFFGGWMIDFCGCKIVFMFIVFLFFVGWFMIGFGKVLGLFYVGRFFFGVGVGCVLFIVLVSNEIVLL